MSTLEEQKKAIRKIAWNIRKMSFIIGAGFSKNISNKYMSWWELMKDMVSDMYSNEINFNDMSIDDIIKKKGYLGIASEYVRRKGYHEAIDDYIEKRTPYLVENDERGFDLELYGRVVERNVDTSLHNTLLSLRPKNIYTFNYDNAFECHKDKVSIPHKKADPSKERELQALQELFIKDYPDKENAVKRAVDVTKEGVDANAISQLESAIQSYNSTIVDCSSSIIALTKLSQDSRIVSILEKNKSILEGRIKDLELETSRYRNNTDTFLLVTNGSDISISAYENSIYKLHGSVRKYDTDKHRYIGDIGFDADSHVQYIITQEDYDTYAVKHEPFVDHMRISLLKESFCIIGFSCDDPNFLLWINWVKDVYERGKDQSEERGPKYYINVDDKHLPDDKKLLLESHYIAVLNLSDVYQDAQTPKERLTEFFHDLLYCGYETTLFDKVWDETNIRTSSNNKYDIKNNEKDIEIAWNESIENPLYFMDEAFYYSRDSIFNYFYDIIKNGLVNDTLAKLFYLAVTRSCLPYYEFLPNKNCVDFLKLIKAEDVKARFIEEDEFHRLLSTGDCDVSKFSPNLRHHIESLKRVFNYDYNDNISFLNNWEPSSQLEKVKKFILSPKTENVHDQLLGLLDKESYYNSKEYLIGLTFLNNYKWNEGYNVIDESESKAISDEIERIKEVEPNIVDFFQYRDEIEKHLTVNPEIKAFGSISTSIRFSSYDDEATSAIKFVVFLAKTGYATNIGISNYVNEKMWIKVVEKVYDYYPYACLYYSSLYYADNSLSKRIGQLYAYNHNLVEQGIIEKLLIKILNACLHYEEYVYIETLLTYANEFINVVRPSSWKNLLQAIIDKKLLKSDSRQWHRHDIVFNFVEHGLELMEDDGYKYKLGLNILHKGSEITNDDNSLLLQCLKKENYTEETRKAIYELTKLTPTLALSMVIFNYRHVLSSKVFNRWLAKVPYEILGNRILLPAVSMLSTRNKFLKEMTFKLIAQSSSLWNTGIKVGVDGNVSSVYGGVDTLYIDSIEEYISIPSDLSKRIYTSLNRRLDEIEKTIKRGFFDQMNEHWCQVLVSIYCFLIRHKNDLGNENDYDNIKNRCHLLYTNLCGYDSILGKLTSSDSYRVSYAITELEMLIHTDGIKNHMSEINYLVFHIADKTCPTVYNGLQLICKLIKDYPNIFKNSGLRGGLVLLLTIYKPYFNGIDSEEWDINARKEFVERMLISINEYLTAIGCPVHVWDNYKPEFWINENI